MSTSVSAHLDYFYRVCVHMQLFISELEAEYIVTFPFSELKLRVEIVLEILVLLVPVLCGY